MGFAVVEQNMYFRSIAIEDNLIKSSHLTFKKVIFGTRPQYSEWTVGPRTCATCAPMFMQFSGYHRPVQAFYWPENAIDWLRER